MQCGKGLKLINNINTRLHLQDNHVNRRLISYLRIFFIQLLGGRKIGYASKISLADFCSLNCGYCKTLLGGLLQRLVFFFALLLKQTCIFIIHLYTEFAERGRIGFYSGFFFYFVWIDRSDNVCSLEPPTFVSEQCCNINLAFGVQQFFFK